MSRDPFDKTFRPRTGQPEELEPGVTLVAAPNAGPMTFTGTNSYLVGQDSLALIDPGPDMPEHEAALMAAIAGRPVSHVLVTHSHVDHSPLARRMADRLDAPVCAHGDPEAARSDVMAALSAQADLGGAEGLDHAFAVDLRLGHGDRLEGGDWTIEALHTPGHLSDHLCFALAGRGAVFSGDHVMGWATTMISPPDGDLTRFMASLDLLAARRDRVFYPGHGGALHDPAGMIAWQKAHRLNREGQILSALGAGANTALGLAGMIYTDIDPRLMPAAARNVLAHLIDLVTRGKADVDGPISQNATFLEK